MEAIEILKDAIMITGFVFMMMLFLEYLNVMTGGAWQKKLSSNRWGQYLVAALLGALPGCLGSFAVVAMYSHCMISFGALTAAMFASAGDESFVMFAMFPGKAFHLHVILVLGGATTGLMVDLLLGRRLTRRPGECGGFVLHNHGVAERIDIRGIALQWRACSAVRGVISLFLVLFILGLASGQVGHDEGATVKVIMLMLSVSALFITATVSDHFLEEHFWGHIGRKHLPRIFVWTLGALLLVHLLTSRLDISGFLTSNRWLVMIAAAITGIIPESGPHLIFVTLFAQGAIPFTVLLVNSIVQDGHGMLPLLAHSRRAFLGIKLINLFLALCIGAALMLFAKG